MAEISAQLVKELRDKTGAGMMDCKKALQEAGGDLAKAEELLRKMGLAAAQKKQGREAGEGLVDAYIHHGGRVGVLIEVNCETDFVARTDDFQQFVHDLALQVAATNPRYVRRDQVPADLLERERALYREQAQAEGKPEHVVDRIVEGKLEKYFEQVCLEDMPFIRDDSVKIKDLVQSMIAKLGENIQIRRFVRFELGEAADEPKADQA